MEITHQTVTVSTLEPSRGYKSHAALRDRMQNEGSERSTELIVAELVQIAQERTDHDEPHEHSRRRRFRRRSD